MILFKIFEFIVAPLAFAASFYYSYREYGKNKTFCNFAGMALTGFLLELSTIMLFKSHNYGYNYSIMIFDVPLVIIIGWTIIIFICHEIVSRLKIKNKITSYLLIGALAVNIDLILDPIAEAVGLWHWDITSTFYGVPAGNFIGWFLIVFLYNFFNNSERLKYAVKNNFFRSLFISTMPVIILSSIAVFWLYFQVEDMISPPIAKTAVITSSLFIFLVGLHYHHRVHYSERLPYKIYDLPDFIFIFLHLVFLGFAIAIYNKALIIWSLFYIAVVSPYLIKTTYFSRRISK